MNIIVAIASFTVLFTFFLLGHFLFYFVNIKSNINPFYSVFVKLILGLFTTVFFFAVYKTGGNTVLWLGAVLLLISYIFIRQSSPWEKRQTSLKKELTQINVYALLALAFFVLIFTAMVSFFFYNEPFNSVPHGDYYYYSKLIYTMKTYGFESNIPIIDPFYNGSIGAMPYHFPELWLATMISTLFKVLPLESIVVYVQVILSTILSIGIVALSRTITKSIIISIMAVISLFFGGIIFVNVIPQMDSFVDFGNAYTPKYAMIGLMFIWSAILFIKQDKLYYLPLLALPIINIALAPAIFTSLILFWILKSIIRRNIKPYIKPTLVTFFIALSIALFYILQPAGVGGLMSIHDMIEIHSALPLKPIKIFMGALFIIVAIHFWYFIPMILALKKSKSILFQSFKPAQDLVLFFGVVLITSSLMWAVFHPMNDSIQFHYLPTYLFLYILIFVLWALSYKAIQTQSTTIKIIFYISCLFVIGVNLIQLKQRAFFKYTTIEKFYSAEYIQEISSILKNNIFNSTGVFIEPFKNIQSPFDACPYCFSRPQLANIIEDFNMINLSSLDYSIAKNDLILEKRARNSLSKAVFTQYVDRIKECSPHTPIDSMQFNYTTEHKINYMVVYPGAELPSVFKSITDTIITDSKYGEMFVVFSCK